VPLLTGAAALPLRVRFVVELKSVKLGLCATAVGAPANTSMSTVQQRSVKAIFFKFKVVRVVAGIRSLVMGSSLFSLVKGAEIYGHCAFSLGENTFIAASFREAEKLGQSCSGRSADHVQMILEVQGTCP
jgi:hypothetical protein